MKYKIGDIVKIKMKLAGYEIPAHSERIGIITGSRDLDIIPGFKAITGHSEGYTLIIAGIENQNCFLVEEDIVGKI
jgi:hypothetical protein